MAADRSSTPPSDEQIRVGDLVRVAFAGEPCPCSCGGATDMRGFIFRVGEIRMTRNRCCWDCGAVKPQVLVAVPDIPLVPGRGAVFPLPRLKRIPPLSELGEVETKETADA